LWNWSVFLLIFVVVVVVVVVVVMGGRGRNVSGILLFGRRLLNNVTPSGDRPPGRPASGN
jgi:hypothetical protein